MNNFEWNTLKSSSADCELNSDSWTCQLGDRFIDFLVLRISSISPLFYTSRKLFRRAIVGFFKYYFEKSFVVLFGELKGKKFIE